MAIQRFFFCTIFALAFTGATSQLKFNVVNTSEPLVLGDDRSPTKIHVGENFVVAHIPDKKRHIAIYSPELKFLGEILVEKTVDLGNPDLVYLPADYDHVTKALLEFVHQDKFIRIYCSRDYVKTQYILNFWMENFDLARKTKLEDVKLFSYEFPESIAMTNQYEFMKKVVDLDLDTLEENSGYELIFGVPQPESENESDFTYTYQSVSFDENFSMRETELITTDTRPSAIDRAFSVALADESGSELVLSESNASGEKGFEVNLSVGEGMTSTSYQIVRTGEDEIIAIFFYKKNDPKVFEYDGISFQKINLVSKDVQVADCKFSEISVDEKLMSAIKAAWGGRLDYSYYDQETNIFHYVFQNYKDWTNGGFILSSIVIYSLDLKEMSGDLRWIEMKAVTTRDVQCYAAVNCFAKGNNVQLLLNIPASKSMTSLNFDDPRNVCTVDASPTGKLPDPSTALTFGEKEYLLTATTNIVRDENYFIATVQGKGYQKLVKVTYE